MNPSRQLTALVVHESMFDNTALIAEAVGRGLGLGGMDVTSYDVSDAPALAAVEVDLLVVGAPTHTFSLSRPSTRADAVRQGAAAERARVGVREWLEGPPLEKGVHLAAMFDTRVRKVRHLPKAAGTRGDHLLRRLGVTTIVRPEAFLVEDVRGPLVDGEVERATSWGRELARICESSLTEAARST
jgi:hypothetical protein